MTPAEKAGGADGRTEALAAELMERARERGFACCGYAPASRLRVDPAVRAMCAADRCRSFGRNWTCPPACGGLDAFAEALARRSACVVVQTVGMLEDEFDIEGMMAAERAHKKRFAAFAREAQDAFDACRAEEGVPRPMALSAGACTLCPTCGCPDVPCRHPARALVSMEAAGLLVSEVCAAAGLPYCHGKNTLAYTSCILL